MPGQGHFFDVMREADRWSGRGACLVLVAAVALSSVSTGIAVAVVLAGTVSPALAAVIAAADVALVALLVLK